jgi:DNA-binding MurR/RpiR family transcriptional regulator
VTLTVQVEDRISEKYADLSAKLQEAADYVVENPTDVATRSLRAVSAASGVSPATLSRLARTLEFESYEDMRELLRGAIESRGGSFAERAERLKELGDSGLSMLDRQTSACVLNISAMTERIDRARLKGAVDALEQARKVVLFGAFSSTGVVEYMAYLANFFNSNWMLADRMGASLGATLNGLSKDDVMLIVTKTPYTRRAVLAAQMVHAVGAQVIVVTDSHACPANKYAHYSFIVPSDSPQFFSSYAATIALLETMIAMLVARSDAATSQRIRDVETRNASLGEFWAD